MDRTGWTDFRNRIARGRRSCLLGLAVAALAALPTAAQLINELDQSQLKTWRMASGNVIRFCQFEVNLTNSFDRAVAEEVADRLLLESEFLMLGASYGIDGDGLEVDIFKSLTNDCEVVLGMQVSDVLFAPEFTVTRPYVSYDYMVVAADPAYASLDDVPPGALIGTPLASAGDLAFARWMATRGDADPWQRVPFARAVDMLDSILAGEVAAMLMFAPVYAVLAAQRPDDAALLNVVSVNEMIANPTSIGGMMLAGSSFLRGEVDQAIDSMIADGTIERLLAENGFGAIPARPGGV